LNDLRASLVLSVGPRAAVLTTALVSQRGRSMREKIRMPSVFVEPRPKGREEGAHIDDNVVEDHTDHILHTSKTQEGAIEWAKRNGHSPHVARVRHLNDKKKPDQWRAA
jgi:hypothetical protein